MVAFALEYLKGEMALKLFFSFMLFLSFLLPEAFFTHSFAPQTTVVKASPLTTYVYARVVSPAAYFYSYPQRSISDNALFVLTESYFVLLLSNYNDTFYKAQYRDLVGFVLKTDVMPVAQTPTTPFLETLSFRVFSSDGKNMYANPTNENSSLVTVVDLYFPIDFYGYISGQEMIKDRGTTWFFGKVGDKFGYLYAGLCDGLSEIVPNTEQMTAIANPFEDDNSFLYNLVEMTPGLKILVLFLLVVPSFFLIYLLFKPYKIIKEKTKIKRRSKMQTIKQIQDYYDDSL